MRIVISMGSNINQEANIQAAKALICKLFDNIEFGKSVWTEPVGLVSDKFLNLLVTAHTGIPKQQVIGKLKQIEQMLGDGNDHHKNGIVNIDLDLIEYDHQKLREVTWLKKVKE